MRQVLRPDNGVAGSFAQDHSTVLNSAARKQQLASDRADVGLGVSVEEEQPIAVGYSRTLVTRLGEAETRAQLWRGVTRRVVNDDYLI